MPIVLGESNEVESKKTPIYKVKCQQIITQFNFPCDQLTTLMPYYYFSGLKGKNKQTKLSSQIIKIKNKDKINKNEDNH